MNFYKYIERIIRYTKKLIPNKYKGHHKYQNKNQITNTEIVLSLLKNEINFSNIVDVGCGHGEWYLKSKKIFPDSNYILFDANIENKNKLEQLSKKNTNFFFFICVLSDKIKNVKFFRMGYGSSLYEENTNHPRLVENLKSSTLSLELEKFNLENDNNLIKLDVQGSELDIINGLGNKLNYFKVIIMEVSVRQYNSGSPLFSDVVSFMDKRNYTLYDICDNKRLGEYNSKLIQLDCVFVKKNTSFLNFNFS